MHHVAQELPCCEWFYYSGFVVAQLESCQSQPERRYFLAPNFLFGGLPMICQPVMVDVHTSSPMLGKRRSKIMPCSFSVVAASNISEFNSSESGIKSAAWPMGALWKSPFLMTTHYWYHEGLLQSAGLKSLIVSCAEHNQPLAAMHQD